MARLTRTGARIRFNKDSANNGSQNGPLRKIVGFLSPALHLFDKDRVELECGHRGTATPGAQRARCVNCKRELQNGNL